MDITTNPLVGFLYAVSKRHAEARNVASELERLSKRQYVSAFAVAIPYAGLNDSDKAIAWLEHAYNERDPIMCMLKVFPWFDPLRSDPRFQDLLRRMNFPP